MSVCVCVTSLYYIYCRVEVGGVDLLPLVKVTLGMLPASVRQKLLVAGVAPKPGNVPRDSWQLASREPYRVEAVGDRVWAVTYTRSRKHNPSFQSINSNIKRTYL